MGISYRLSGIGQRRKRQRRKGQKREV